MLYEGPFFSQILIGHIAIGMLRYPTCRVVTLLTLLIVLVSRVSTLICEFNLQLINGSPYRGRYITIVLNSLRGTPKWSINSRTQPTFPILFVFYHGRVKKQLDIFVLLLPHLLAVLSVLGGQRIRVEGTVKLHLLLVLLKPLPRVATFWFGFLVS